MQHLTFLNATHRLLINAIKKEFAKELAVVEIEPVRKQSTSLVPVRKSLADQTPIDQFAAARFYNYRPTYWTRAGQLTCRMQKVAVSPKTGETVAYYDLVEDLPTGRVVTTYLYAIVNGEIKERKRFDTRPWRD